jgi:hypothetical protein
MTVRRRGAIAILAGLVLGGGGAASATHASDVDPPRGAVGGLTSPASGTMVLHVRATGADVGLASAGASVDGVVVASADLCAPACPSSVEDVPLSVPTTGFGDGTHQLQVRVTDAAGASTVLVDQPFVINNTPPASQSSVLVTLGSGADPAAPDGGGPGGGGDVVGGAGGAVPGGRPACAAPRLSMFLKTKPLRVVKRVPVLRKGGKYRFSGTLTCVVGGRRVHAHSGLKVALLNQIGKRTYRKRAVTTRFDGTLAVVLTYPSSRLLEFRYQSIDGATTRVRIRITVARATEHPAKKRKAR